MPFGEIKGFELETHRKLNYLVSEIGDPFFPSCTSDCECPADTFSPRCETSERDGHIRGVNCETWRIIGLSLRFSMFFKAPQLRIQSRVNISELDRQILPRFWEASDLPKFASNLANERTDRWKLLQNETCIFKFYFASFNTPLILQSLKAKNPGNFLQRASNLKIAMQIEEERNVAIVRSSTSNTPQTPIPQIVPSATSFYRTLRAYRLKEVHHPDYIPVRPKPKQRTALPETMKGRSPVLSEIHFTIELRLAKRNTKNNENIAVRRSSREEFLRAERGGVGSSRRSSRVESAKVRDWLRGGGGEGEEGSQEATAKGPGTGRRKTIVEEARVSNVTAKRDEKRCTKIHRERREESAGGKGSKGRRDIYIGGLGFLRAAAIINIHNPELETSVERAARRPHAVTKNRSVPAQKDRPKRGKKEPFPRHNSYKSHFSRPKIHYPLGGAETINKNHKYPTNLLRNSMLCVKRNATGTNYREEFFYEKLFVNLYLDINYRLTECQTLDVLPTPQDFLAITKKKFKFQKITKELLVNVHLLDSDITPEIIYGVRKFQETRRDESKSSIISSTCPELSINEERSQHADKNKPIERIETRTPRQLSPAGERGQVGSSSTSTDIDEEKVETQGVAEEEQSVKNRVKRGGVKATRRAYSESRLTARQRAWQRARTTSGEENAGTSQLVDEQTQKRNSVETASVFLLTENERSMAETSPRRRRLTARGIWSDLPELCRLIKTNAGSHGTFIRSPMEAFSGPQWRTKKFHVMFRHNKKELNMIKNRRRELVEFNYEKYEQKAAIKFSFGYNRISAMIEYALSHPRCTPMDPSQHRMEVRFERDREIVRLAALRAQEASETSKDSSSATNLYAELVQSNKLWRIEKSNNSVQGRKGKRLLIAVCVADAAGQNQPTSQPATHMHKEPIVSSYLPFCNISGNRAIRGVLSGGPRPPPATQLRRARMPAHGVTGNSEDETLRGNELYLSISSIRAINQKLPKDLLLGGDFFREIKICKEEPISVKENCCSMFQNIDLNVGSNVLKLTLRLEEESQTPLPFSYHILSYRLENKQVLNCSATSDEN
ncbi:hypothetical protein WN51_05881 [Melipona quadrifasciata]|uniref:Uncharacterized protein n=1 Tax=Melipona quadrifasciata TaxID=166423 RepID=A0A0M9A8C1_9HYME|nr:hypothetical protein WN51_05881 [Melipona quadrifasciata]